MQLINSMNRKVSVGVVRGGAHHRQKGAGTWCLKVAHYSTEGHTGSPSLASCGHTSGYAFSPGSSDGVAPG